MSGEADTTSGAIGSRHNDAACACCGEFPGTEKFVRDGGAHGMYEMWCKGCVLRAQIEHIEDCIVALGELKAELREREAVDGAA